LGVGEEGSFLLDESEPGGEDGLVEFRDVGCVVEVVDHGVQTYLHALDAVANHCRREHSVAVAVTEEDVAVFGKRQLYHPGSHVLLDNLLHCQLQDALELKDDFPHYHELSAELS